MTATRFFGPRVTMGALASALDIAAAGGGGRAGGPRKGGGRGAPRPGTPAQRGAAARGGSGGRPDGPVRGGVAAHPDRIRPASPAETIAAPIREADRTAFFIWFLLFLQE